MKQILRILWVSFLMMAAVLKGSAQRVVTIQITDGENIPADAASVIITEIKERKVVGNGIAGTDGKIIFHLNDGEYQVYISLLGYKNVLEKIRIPSDSELYSFVLEPEIAHLSDVIVTARQRRPVAKMIDGKVSINVSRSYLTDLGNAVDVLKHSPGIRVGNDGNISLSSPGGTAVYVNGKRIRLQGDLLTAYLRSLPSSKIERIVTSPNPDASYESEGAGGVIDIILKRNEDTGLHLTTSHGLAYWEHLRETSDVGLSYHRKDWQIGVNYNQSIGHYGMRYGSERLQDGNRNLSETVDTDKRNVYAGGMDFVWQPNGQHKLSFLTSVDAVVGPGKTITETRIYHETNALKQILRAENDYIKQRNLKYGGGLNYLFTPSSRHSVSVSTDWIHVNGTSRNNQPNAYFMPDGSPARRDLYYSDTEKDIDILSLMTDYKLTIGKEDDFLSGLKLSRIISNNDFRFFTNSVFNTNRSNRFKYSETNIEGYAQYTMRRAKWAITAGLRAEYMHTDGQLQPFGKEKAKEENKRNRFGLFPNLSVSYQATDVTKLTLSYSKRQDKPKYEDLNPFEYLLDELTYWKGNPFISPQVSHRLMLNLAVRNLGLTLSYNQLNDYFTALTDTYEKGTIVMTTKNIGRQKQMGLELVYSRRLVPWWDISFNGGAFYFINQLDYEKYKETYRRPSCVLSLSNDILLPAGIRLELSGRYNSKRQGNSYEVLKSTGSVDAGFSKSLLKNQLNLSLLMTDIFHTERWDSYGTKEQLDLTSWGQGESRQLLFRVRFQLGIQKLKADKKEIKELDRL